MNSTIHAWNPAILGVHPFRAAPAMDLQAEIQLLGALLTGTCSWAEAVAALSPDQFADPIHGTIFRAIGNCPEPGCSLEELLKHFDATGGLDEVGGPAYLRHLISAVPAGFDPMVAVAAIHEAWIRRKVQDVGDALVTMDGGA